MRKKQDVGIKTGKKVTRKGPSAEVLAGWVNFSECAAEVAIRSLSLQDRSYKDALAYCLSAIERKELNPDTLSNEGLICIMLYGSQGRESVLWPDVLRRGSSLSLTEVCYLARNARFAMIKDWAESRRSVLLREQNQNNPERVTALKIHMTPRKEVALAM
jgi:hypothetical protein